MVQITLPQAPGKPTNPFPTPSPLYSVNAEICQCIPCNKKINVFGLLGNFFRQAKSVLKSRRRDIKRIELSKDIKKRFEDIKGASPALAAYCFEAASPALAAYCFEAEKSEPFYDIQNDRL